MADVHVPTEVPVRYLPRSAGASTAVGAMFVIGLYSFAFPQLPNDGGFQDTFRETLPESGAYVFPALPRDMADEELMNLYTEKHKSGAEPMSPLLLLKGFGIEFLAALIICMLLWWSRIDSFGGRVSFVFFATLFAVVTTHAVQWNFFYLPAEYTFALMIDALVGWLLAGFVMAAVVRPRVVEAAVEN